MDRKLRTLMSPETLEVVDPRLQLPLPEILPPCSVPRPSELIRLPDSLPPRFKLAQVTSQNVGDLKHLCQCLFPLPYPASLFREVSKGQKLRAVLAVMDDDSETLKKGSVIGCMAWERVPDSEGRITKVNLLLFGVRVLLRRRGVGTVMWRMLTERIEPAADEIAFVVHAENHGAIKMYEAMGCETKDVCKNYYKRLECPDGVLMTWSRSQD